MAGPWSADDVKKLIDVFKQNDVMWKVDHSDYGKRGPRYKALKKISIELGGRGMFHCTRLNGSDIGTEPYWLLIALRNQLQLPETSGFCRIHGKILCYCLGP